MHTITCHQRFCSSREKTPPRCQWKKYDPGKKASKRKRNSDVKTADPKPSTSQDKSISEQQQDMPATEQQQDKASDTLTSQSSDDSIILPDYGPALKTFTTKDPSSIPKKPRYSLHLKTE